MGTEASWGLGPSGVGALSAPCPWPGAHNWEWAFQDPAGRRQMWDPWPSWGTGRTLDQPRDLRQTCLPISSRSSRTLPRSHFECCRSPSGSMVRTKHTQSCSCARRRLHALLRLMVTVPTSCPAQEDAGKMPQRGHQLVVTSLAGTGLNSRREAGREGA